MSRKEKSRIDTNGGRDLTANGLNALGALDVLNTLGTSALPCQPASAAAETNPNADGRKADDGNGRGGCNAVAATPGVPGASAALQNVSGRTAADRNVAGEAAIGTRSRGRLDLRWSKSGRGGKVVTVISGEGFATAGEAELEALLKQLKNRFGCGGKCEQRTLELQGKLVDQVQPLLAQMGYRVVRVGG